MIELAHFSQIVSQTVRKRRLERGLTQAQLAHKAGICLATYQNFEANRANPEFKTLMRIFETLGLEIKIEESDPTLETFIAYGVPLLARSRGHLFPTRDGLKDILSQVRPDSLIEGLNEKERSALLAWCWALRDHYPRVWKQASKLLQSWFLRQRCGAQEVKLRRISVQALGEYL